jgi:hypothetical protein
LAKTVNFIYELVHVIQDLYENGTEPKLGVLDVAHHSKEARGSVEKVLRKLIQPPNE